MNILRTPSLGYNSAGSYKKESVAKIELPVKKLIGNPEFSRNLFLIFWTFALSALQITASQQSITANLWHLTAHIYHAMITMIDGFSKIYYYYHYYYYYY